MTRWSMSPLTRFARFSVKMAPNWPAWLSTWDRWPLKNVIAPVAYQTPSNVVISGGSHASDRASMITTAVTPKSTATGVS